MHKSILDLLDEKYDLHYVDYNDSLDNNLELIQKAIWEGNDWPIYESLDFFDDNYGVTEALKELSENIQNRFDVDEDRANSFVEDHSEELVQIIEERDYSDPVKDMLRHTRDIVLFFETGVELYGMTWGSREDEYKESVRLLKKTLGIKQKDKTWDDKIDALFADAYYGGKLVIYFLGDPIQSINLGSFNKITFTNPYVAIIDNDGGSGNHEYFKGLQVSFDFHPRMLFIDKLVHYSYTYEVCGMVNDWCSDTEVYYSKSGKKVKTPESATLAYMEEEARRDKIFREGGCTPGDMNMQRHRDTYYLNEFPCGTHCPHCHTFWID